MDFVHKARDRFEDGIRVYPCLRGCRSWRKPGCCYFRTENEHRSNLCEDRSRALQLSELPTSLVTASVSLSTPAKMIRAHQVGRLEARN